MNINDFCEWLFEQNVNVLYVNQGVCVDLHCGEYVVIVEGLKILYVEEHSLLTTGTRRFSLQYLINKIEDESSLINARIRDMFEVYNPTRWGSDTDLMIGLGDIFDRLR